MNNEPGENSELESESAREIMEDISIGMPAMILSNPGPDIEGRQPEGDKQPLSPRRDPENSLQDEMSGKDGEEAYTSEEVVKQKELMLKDIQEKAGLNNMDDATNFPNKSSLIINAVIACLEDENLLVQRMSLDFLNSHLKLSYELFIADEKLILVEAVLYLLIKKDLSICRRVYTWYIEKIHLSLP